MKVTWIRTPEPSERKSSDPLRFLFGSSVCYPPFAKTRRIAAQTIARWRKLTQTSRRKPRMVSAIFFWRFWLFCFLHNIFFFCKASLCTVQKLLSRQRSLKGRKAVSCQRVKTWCEMFWRILAGENVWQCAKWTIPVEGTRTWPVLSDRILVALRFACES